MGQATRLLLPGDQKEKGIRGVGRLSKVKPELQKKQFVQSFSPQHTALQALGKRSLSPPALFCKGLTTSHT